MSALRRSLVFSFADRYASLTLNVATTAIIARLLTPADIGLFAVGMALVMVIETLRDFGVSVYLVQEKTITRNCVRTTFTVLLLLSLAFAGAIVAVSGPLAVFYNEPTLAPLLQVIAVSFLVGPFSSPVLALLRRDMKFGTVALVNFAAAMANLVVAAVLAWQGFGAMSLGWATLASVIAAAAMAAFARGEWWIYVPSLTAWRKVLSFGGLASATALLNVIYQQIPQLVLARILNLDAVGLYSRALLVCQIPERALAGALQPVVLSAFSHGARTGSDLKAAYLRSISYVTAVQWPALAVLALLASPVVAVLLGPQWTHAVPLVRIMAVASLSLVATMLSFPMLVAMGRIRDALLSSLISLPIAAIINVAAAFKGVDMLAASLLVTGPLQAVVAIEMIRRNADFSYLDLARHVWRSLLVTLGAVVGPLLVIAGQGGSLDMSVPLGILAAGLSVIGWGLTLVLVAHPLTDELRGLLTRRRGAAIPAGEAS